MDWFLYDNDLHHERVKGRTTRFFFSSASVLHFIHLVYSCPYLGIDLFMSYLCDVFFFFSLTFIVIDHITQLKQMHLFCVHFLEYILFFEW